MSDIAATQTGKTGLGRAWRQIGFGGLLLLFAIAHFVYNGYFGYLFFKWSGGVTQLGNGWVRYGGIARTWENPVLIPAFALGDVVDAHPNMASVWRIAASVTATVLFLGALVVSGWAPASLVCAAWSREKPLWGKYYWRLWLLLLTWGWVLAPEQYSFVYQYTVKY